MTELRINGFRQIKSILDRLLPFIRFKKDQANALYQATSILSVKSLRDLTKKELLKIIEYILLIQSKNYATKKKKNKEELLKILDLTP